MKIALIGTGLIGGSFVLGLKQKSTESIEVIGIDKTESHLAEAQKRGIIDRSASDWREVVPEADLVVLAIPVDAIVNILPDVLSACGSNTLVVDFGSTKEAICASVANHPKRSQFLAAHPIAGTEYSGPGAAFPDLFSEKVMILCEEQKTNDHLKSDFLALCDHFSVRIAYMTPQQHDLHLAFVSHLSHISSFALSNTVLGKETTENQIFEMAGSGFASTVRLAKSSPEMWAPILLQNKQHLLSGLRSYIIALESFLNSLEKHDEAGLKQLMTDANRIKAILDDIR